MTNHVFSDAEIEEILNLINGTRHTQYIGARYVPIFGRVNETTIEWDNKAPYEPLTIVIHQGNSYTSRQYVPVGIDINNTDFWALTGNYNAQVEAYRKDTQNALTLAQTNKTDIAAINANLSTKADKATTYTKSDIDDKVAAIDATNETPLLLSITRDPSLIGDNAFMHAFISKSYDGINWYVVKDFHPSNNLSDAPTLFVYNGYVYVIDAGAGAGGSFVTKDLKSWTEFNVLNQMKKSHMPNIPSGDYWAPKLFCDTDTGALYMASAYQYKDGHTSSAVNAISATSQGVQYRKPCFFDVSVGDGGVLTVGQYHELNFGMGDNDSYIDPYILKHNGIWYLAVKNEIKTTIEVYKSLDLVNWSKMNINGDRVWGVEAPALVEISDDVLGLYVSGYDLLNSSRQNLSINIRTPKALFQPIPIKYDYNGTDKYGVSYHEVRIPLEPRHFCVCQANTNQYNRINPSLFKSITVNSDKKDYQKVGVHEGIAIATNDPDYNLSVGPATTELYLATVIDIREGPLIKIHNASTDTPVTLTSTPVSKYPEMSGIGDRTGNCYPSTITIPPNQYAVFVPAFLEWTGNHHPWRCISISGTAQS